MNNQNLPPSSGSSIPGWISFYLLATLFCFVYYHDFYQALEMAAYITAGFLVVIYGFILLVFLFGLLVVILSFVANKASFRYRR